MDSINRIRLEFKANTFIKHIEIILVLIESDWNLKVFERWKENRSHGVLIESDWNLKHDRRERSSYCPGVLIESDWNLKLIHIMLLFLGS